MAEIFVRRRWFRVPRRPVAEGQVDAIRALRERWIKAISEADIVQLEGLMEDDVVVVHGDGRCLSGRDAVLADFASAFERFRVSQRAEPHEIIVAGAWAIERARVHTVLTPLADGERREVDSHTWTVLRKASPHGWRVARVIGVVEQPRRGTRTRRGSTE